MKADSLFNRLPATATQQYVSWLDDFTRYDAVPLSEENDLGFADVLEEEDSNALSCLSYVGLRHCKAKFLCESLSKRI